MLLAYISQKCISRGLSVSILPFFWTILVVGWNVVGRCKLLQKLAPVTRLLTDVIPNSWKEEGCI